MKNLLSILFSTIFGASAHAAPRILFSGSDLVELPNYHDSAVTFTVVATDGGNQQTLTGAVLTDPQSGAVYGGFQTGTEKGTYVLSLSRTQITRARPVDPTAGIGEMRAFRATVFDNQGAQSSVTFTIFLSDSTKYTALPVDFFSQLPIEFVQYHQRNWIAYHAQKDFNIKAGDSFYLYYDKKKNMSSIFYRPTQYDSETVLSRPGKEFFQSFKAQLETWKFGLYPVSETQDGTLLKTSNFRFRCIERKQQTQINCWKY